MTNRAFTAIGCLVAGTASTAVGLYGFFDHRIHYCDQHTKPCTPAIVTADWQLPKTALVVETLPGTGMWRTLGALAGVAFFAAGYTLTQQAEKQQQQIEADLANLAVLEASRVEVLTLEEQKKLAIAADLRVRLFERDIKEASALLYLQQHPELLEVLTRKPEPPEPSPSAPTPEPTEEKPAPSLSPKEKLTQLIQEHEGGWIAQLMKKPVLIYGDMGGFKSYLAAFLALVRYYLHGHKIISICDPHFHQNKDSAWKYLVKLGTVGYGSHQDYASVSKCLELMYDRFATRTQKDCWVTSIWDEVTNYNLYKECKEAASLFIRKVLTDPRKAHEAPIIIAHDDTLETLGGANGVSKAKERGLIKLELYSDSDNKPLFKGRLSGIKNENGQSIEDMEVTIKPDWIRPEFVYKLFSHETKPLALDDSPKQEQKTFREQVNKFLEDCWQGDAIAPDISPDNPPDCPPDCPPEPPLSLTETPEVSGEQDYHKQPDSLSGDKSGFVWSVEKVSEFYPEITPLRLFELVSVTARLGTNARDIIKTVLKCYAGNNHPTRSYSRHGKTLLRWLIETYDNGAISNLPEIKKFLTSEK